MAKGGKGKRTARRREKKNIPHGVAHIQATFNNTIITISDTVGNVLAWSSAGRVGFKGSRKGTPFAAQMASQQAVIDQCTVNSFCAVQYAPYVELREMGRDYSLYPEGAAEAQFP